MARQVTDAIMHEEVRQSMADDINHMMERFTVMAKFYLGFP